MQVYHATHLHHWHYFMTLCISFSLPFLFTSWPSITSLTRNKPQTLEYRYTDVLQDIGKISSPRPARRSSSRPWLRGDIPQKCDIICDLDRSALYHNNVMRFVTDPRVATTLRARTESGSDWLIRYNILIYSCTATIARRKVMVQTRAPVRLRMMATTRL